MCLGGRTRSWTTFWRLIIDLGLVCWFGARNAFSYSFFFFRNGYGAFALEYGKRVGAWAFSAHGKKELRVVSRGEAFARIGKSCYARDGFFMVPLRYRRHFTGAGITGPVRLETAYWLLWTWTGNAFASPFF